MDARLCKVFVSATLVAATSCVEAPTAPPGLPAFLVASMPNCTTSGVQAVFFTPRRPCGDQIRIGPAAGSEAYAQQIADAANAWNSALSDPLHRVLGIPIFVPGTGYDVQVAVSGLGPYCGEDTFGPGAPWGVVNLHTSDCANKNTGDLTTTLTHELSHVLGLGDNGERYGVEGVSDGCTTNLNQDLTINALVCQHDVEMVYAAYGQRGAQALPIDFWSQAIITGLDIVPTSMTLEPGQQDSAAVTCLRFDRPGGRTSGGAQLAPPITGCSLTGFGFTWSSDRLDVASVVGSAYGATITGAGPGSTKVRAGIGSGVPTTLQLGVILATLGSEVAVTVNGSAGPFKATAITGLPTPVTSAGTYSLWAAVASKPAGTLQVGFNISTSDGAFKPYFTGFRPSPYLLTVQGGSYRLHIEAIPYVAGQTGFGFAADFPVCTGGGGGGGGGGDLVAPRDSPTPDAVGGC